jgi:hypothetical protein
MIVREEESDDQVGWVGLGRRKRQTDRPQGVLRWRGTVSTG